MEIAYDFSELFSTEPIQRLDRAQLEHYNQKKFWAVQEAIDTLGQLSSKAQGLKNIRTSCEELVKHYEDQFLYLMWHRHPMKPSTSVVIGMLKVSRKHLYLLAASQIERYQEDPICILDFYIHESVQRKGYGHQLFDYMLRHEGTTAKAVAIDHPSDAFLQFMEKFYGLKKPVWQSTNFVVFPEFFEGKKPTHQNEHCGTGSRSEQFGSSKNEPLLVSQYLSTDRNAHEAGKDSVDGLLHNYVEP